MSSSSNRDVRRGRCLGPSSRRASRPFSAGCSSAASRKRRRPRSVPCGGRCKVRGCLAHCSALRWRRASTRDAPAPPGRYWPGSLPSGACRHDCRRCRRARRAPEATERSPGGQS
eukprot:scaffold126698_cov75-Phaeocystis_antarctica.AAC.3